jgi:hypothetical protein
MRRIRIRPSAIDADSGNTDILVQLDYPCFLNPCLYSRLHNSRNLYLFSLELKFRLIAQVH